MASSLSGLLGIVSVATSLWSSSATESMEASSGEALVLADERHHQILCNVSSTQAVAMGGAATNGADATSENVRDGWGSR